MHLSAKLHLNVRHKKPITARNELKIQRPPFSYWFHFQENMSSFQANPSLMMFGTHTWNKRALNQKLIHKESEKRIFSWPERRKNVFYCFFLFHLHLWLYKNEKFCHFVVDENQFEYNDALFTAFSFSLLFSPLW